MFRFTAVHLQLQETPLLLTLLQETLLCDGESEAIWPLTSFSALKQLSPLFHFITQDVVGMQPLHLHRT